MLYGMVDYIITDCPLHMGVFYDQKYNDSTLVQGAVEQFITMTADDVERINFLVHRSKKFIEHGRFCSERSALETDDELKAYCLRADLDITPLAGSLDEQVKTVVETILAGGHSETL
jgi:hypothetical protein